MHKRLKGAGEERASILKNEIWVGGPARPPTIEPRMAAPALRTESDSLPWPGRPCPNV